MFSMDRSDVVLLRNERFLPWRFEFNKRKFRNIKAREMNFTSLRNKRLQKKQKKILYKYDGEYRGKTKPKSHVRTLMDLRFETSNHSGIQHIKSGASRFPLRISRPTKTFRVIWTFRNNNPTIIHRA